MKKLFTIYSGSGYAVQPRHKSMMLPDNYLLAFLKVRCSDLNAVVDFCNNYQVNPIWIYTQEKTLTDGFREIQNAFYPIAEKVLQKEPLSFREITILNRYLSKTRFHISIRKEPLEMTNFEQNFELLVPENGKYEIKFIGSADIDPENARVNISFSKEAGKSLSYKKIEKGLFAIEKYFPDPRWNLYREFADQMIIKTKIINDGDWFNPVRIDQEVSIRDNNFSFNDIDAAYSCPTFESKLAHLIWERLNNKRKDETIKRCAICGELYRKGKDSRSIYYCSNTKCKNEWNNNKYGKQRYKKDQTFREKKIKQATLNKQKVIKA